MKTHNHLYEEICSFENLLLAARKAEAGKRFQGVIGGFRTNVEAELLQLQRELREQTYQPGGYHEKWIERPKRRMISAAPFRDRVVHHAVCNVVMPLFERKMVFDLYSNRAGKGTHAAIHRCQEYSRQFGYVLKCDVRKFFPSMDHAVLKQTLRKTIACRDTLWLLDRIIDGSNRQEAVCNVFPGDNLVRAAARRVGLPIGNLTSQWFGCIYLTPLDHWVKEQLRCPGYVRYVDDFLLFSDDKRQLAEWRAAVRAKLVEFRLNLNERKSRTYRTSDGLTFLGQRVWPGRRRLCRENVTAARRRLRWTVRRFQRGWLSKDGLLTRWNSWRGHALQADGAALLERVTSELRMILGRSEREQPCLARRQLEQQRQQHAVRQSQQQQPGQPEQQHRVPLCEGDSERGGRTIRTLSRGRSAPVHGLPQGPERKPTVRHLFPGPQDRGTNTQASSGLVAEVSANVPVAVRVQQSRRYL